MSFEDEYRKLMEKPIEEIKEDIFFRPDNFQKNEPWYGDFQMYMTGGVCQPPEEHAPASPQGPEGDGLRHPHRQQGRQDLYPPRSRRGRPHGS